MENDSRPLLEQAQNILDRLEVVFKEQGLNVAIDRLEGDRLFINLERTAKGMPVLFMVKAIGGTFRRYLPAIQNVEINSFTKTVEQPSDKETSQQPLFSFNGIPELDMSGINPQDAVLALDNFASLVRRHNLHKFRISWKDRVEAATILPRWVRSINACMHQQGDMTGKYIVHIPAIPLDESHDPHCGLTENGDVLPARIMITMPRQPEASKGLD
ncbi:MAG: hypothetical protein Q4F00_04890 [bacterium]|nr:hypothetical protein [bacterium]